MKEVTVTYNEMFKAAQKLIGRKVRTKLAVNMWGDIYNRNKKGIISSIKIKADGIYFLVLFKWKAMRGFQQQELWIKFEELQFQVYEIEDSLGYII